LPHKFFLGKIFFQKYACDNLRVREKIFFFKKVQKIFNCHIKALTLTIRLSDKEDNFLTWLCRRVRKPKRSTYCKELLIKELEFLEKKNDLPDYLVHANEYGTGRPHRLRIRLSDDELDLLNWQACRFDMKPSPVARQAILARARIDAGCLWKR
jgi:hypothetical protein